MGHNFIANCVDQPLECIGTAIVDNSLSQSHAQQHFRLTLQQYLSLAAEIIVAVLEGEMELTDCDVRLICRRVFPEEFELAGPSVLFYLLNITFDEIIQRFLVKKLL
jgi:hypothetical protein